MHLERGLNKRGIPLNKKNIWDSPEAASTVRSIANGNETVPTVVVGDAALVNPSAGQVIQAISNQAPELLPPGVEVPEPGQLSRRINKLLGG